MKCYALITAVLSLYEMPMAIRIKLRKGLRLPLGPAGGLRAFSNGARRPLFQNFFASAHMHVVHAACAGNFPPPRNFARPWACRCRPRNCHAAIHFRAFTAHHTCCQLALDWICLPSPNRRMQTSPKQGIAHLEQLPSDSTAKAHGCRTQGGATPWPRTTRLIARTTASR